MCGCPCLQKCQCLGVRGHMAERPHWLSDPAAGRRAPCALRPAVGARARASARHRPHRDRGFSGQTSGADPLTPETTQGPGRRFRETPAPRWPLCLPSALLDVPTNLGQGPAGPRADGRVPAVTEAQAAAKAHDSGAIWVGCRAAATWEASPGAGSSSSLSGRGRGQAGAGERVRRPSPVRTRHAARPRASRTAAPSSAPSAKGHVPGGPAGRLQTPP